LRRWLSLLRGGFQFSAYFKNCFSRRCHLFVNLLSGSSILSPEFHNFALALNKKSGWPQPRWRIMPEQRSFSHRHHRQNLPGTLPLKRL
jgi:hypothetical protein